MGVGKRLKEVNPNLKIIAVQPKGCDMKNGKYIPHKIQATAVGQVGSFVDFSLIDDFIDVDFEEIQELRANLAKREGLFVGISSGANILASVKISYQTDKNVVTVAPDSARSYLC